MPMILQNKATHDLLFSRFEHSQFFTIIHLDYAFIIILRSVIML